MISTEFPSLEQIREAHSWKRDYEKFMPLSRYVYRPIGFLATWGAVRIGMTTEMVSFLSGIVGTIACLLLICKDEACLIFGIFLLHLFNLLDCVDGSIARVMKTENTYGKFLDSVMGDLVDFVFFFALSIMVFRHPDLLTWSNPFEKGATFWLLIGCLCGFLYIYLRHVEMLYEFQIYNKQETISSAKSQNDNRFGMKPHFTKTKAVDLKNSLRLLDRNIRARETKYFILIIFFSLSAVDLFLLSYCAYYFLHVIFSGILYCRNAKKIRDIE